MATPFQLAFALHGHSADVRNLAVETAPSPLLASTSRDGSAIVWGPSASGKEWTAKLRVEELEKRIVSCATFVKHMDQLLLVIGSSSGMLSSYILPKIDGESASVDAPTQEPYHTLLEHSQNLCCIDASPSGLLATGSWDKTVIIWKDFQKVIQIKTHSQAVWAIKFVGDDRILTAAADKTITLHSIDVANGTTIPLQSYTGHSDCVRGVSLCPDGSGFWSCGNDGLVNLYSFDQPSPTRTFSGHTSFVYSVSAFPDGTGAVSSGEDGTLRVWSNKDLVQSIPHPSMSLWSGAVVPSASGTSYYIASAAADSTVRFFTRQEDLMASPEDRAAWDEEIKQRKLDKSQVGDVKRSDLPGMEALGRQGKKDGEVIMIKNDDNVEAYQWQAADSTWQQIGQVVDAIGSGRKQLYEGKEYDHVFDVDVAEGVPPLKLPYNITENPWIAAQRFLERNELPSGYAEQVVDFIQKNTGGVQLGTGGGSDFVDPFTGASRYTGGGVQTGSGSGGGDPLTGGSRYTGGGVQTGSGSSSRADPFTGGGAYSTQATSITKILPVKTLQPFKGFNAKAAQGKLDQFKSTSPELTIDEATATSLTAAFQIAGADKIATTETYDPAKILALVLQWDEDHRFPLIDLLRALAAISPALGSCTSAPNTLMEAAGWGTPWSAAKMCATNQMLAMRALNNLFMTGSGKKTMIAAAEEGILVDLVKGRKWAEVGTAKVPLATVAMSYSILAATGHLSSNLAGPLLGLIIHIVDNEKTDSETIYRASVALGNLLSSPGRGALMVFDVQRAKQLVTARAGTLKEKRLTDLATEISSLDA